jgi:type IV pilus assembly protein PilE
VAQARTAAGFTLIEVMAALAIVAITTTIAATSFRRHLQRSHRLDAVHALLVAASEQEKFHLAHGRYADRLDASAGDEPPGLPVASRTPGGHYLLDVVLADAAEFRVVATATGNHPASECRMLWIDESGRRSATDARGADSARRCW